MYRFIIWLSLLQTIYVSGQTVTVKTINIDPYLTFQNYEHFKRLTLSSPDSPAEYVDGFIFDWGYRYELKVRETKLPVALSDGTKYKYSLISIVSKTRVPDSAQFNLFLDPDRYYYRPNDPDEQKMNVTLKPINDSTYLYFDEVEIEVPANFRAEFSLITEEKMSANGLFSYIHENRIRLIRLLTN